MYGKHNLQVNSCLYVSIYADDLEIEMFYILRCMSTLPSKALPPAVTTFSKLGRWQVHYSHHCSPIITLLRYVPPAGQWLWLSGQSHWPSWRNFAGYNLRALCEDGVLSSILCDKVQWRWHHDEDWQGKRDTGNHFQGLLLFWANAVYTIMSEIKALTQTL